MSPMTNLSRLAALVPAPHANEVTCHGALASAASYRDRVVPTIYLTLIWRVGLSRIPVLLSMA